VLDSVSDGALEAVVDCVRVRTKLLCRSCTEQFKEVPQGELAILVGGKCPRRVLGSRREANQICRPLVRIMVRWQSITERLLGLCSGRRKELAPERATNTLRREGEKV
jgi:hypothetical protein